MDHGQPVESLLLYPSEGLLVSAGRAVVVVLNKPTFLKNMFQQSMAFFFFLDQLL